MVSVYIKGLALGALLLIATMAALWIMDEQRTGFLSKDIQDMTWEIEDSRLYMSYLESLDVDSCGVMQARVVQQAHSSEELVKRIDSYQNANMFSGDYYALKKTFFYKNFELFLNLKKLKNNCGADVNHILYFYAENDRDQSLCPDCGIQAAVLDTIGEECPNTWTFAIPYNSDIGLANILKEQYEVSQIPAVIVNGELMHQGLVGKEEIESKISCGPRPFGIII